MPLLCTAENLWMSTGPFRDLLEYLCYADQADVVADTPDFGAYVS